MVRLCLALLIGVLLSGCETASDAALKTLREALWGAPPPPDSKNLDPRFNYLRVTEGKNVAFLAQGYVEPHPGGPIEIWYSATHQVLRLQQGRVVGLTGAYAEWQRVQLPADLASWASLVRNDQVYEFERVRDLMPGYRYGVRDRLRLQPTAPPRRSALVAIAPESLAWFEEVMVATVGGEMLPPARYAVALPGGEGRVIYGEQCLSEKLCIAWQRWVAGQ